VQGSSVWVAGFIRWGAGFIRWGAGFIRWGAGFIRWGAGFIRLGCRVHPLGCRVHPLGCRVHPFGLQGSSVGVQGSSVWVAGFIRWGAAAIWAAPQHGTSTRFQGRSAPGRICSWSTQQAGVELFLLAVHPLGCCCPVVDAARHFNLIPGTKLLREKDMQRVNTPRMSAGLSCTLR
jgi:hypothetical protein